jgi:hypothetical protein
MTGHTAGCDSKPGVLTLAGVRRILTEHPSLDGTLCPLAAHALASVGDPDGPDQRTAAADGHARTARRGGAR